MSENDEVFYDTEDCKNMRYDYEGFAKDAKSPYETLMDEIGEFGGLPE